MSEKRVFECTWGANGQNYLDELSIDVGIRNVTGQLPERAFLEMIEGKHVRVTIEELKQWSPSEFKSKDWQLIVKALKALKFQIEENEENAHEVEIILQSIEDRGLAKP